MCHPATRIDRWKGMDSAWQTFIVAFFSLASHLLGPTHPRPSLFLFKHVSNRTHNTNDYDDNTVFFRDRQIPPLGHNQNTHQRPHAKDSALGVATTLSRSRRSEHRLTAGTCSGRFCVLLTIFCWWRARAERGFAKEKKVDITTGKEEGCCCVRLREGERRN